MTPIEEITAAANKLRSTAHHAGGQTWIADHFPEGTIVRPADSTSSLFRLAADGMRAAGTPHVVAPVGEYIATMHPRVGKALADLLDDQADGDDEGVVNPWALAVARQILGTTP